MDAERYYETAVGPLNQGDILIAPVARVSSIDLFVPDKWDLLDQFEYVVDRSIDNEEDMHVFSGRALVMVISHDCHHDKEWNAERTRLIRLGYDPDEASKLAEGDSTLDQTFQASPLVPLDDFKPNSRGNHRAGRVTGYYPLPQPPDGSFPDSVVDLTYRCTIDRKAITERRWRLTAYAWDRLRYAIARFDSFRTVELSESIEAAIGKSIIDVRVNLVEALMIELELDDDSVLKLVQPPIDPSPGGRSSI